MVHDYFDKHIFLCEMYNEHTDQIQKLVLNFFPFNNSIQIVDPDKGKFLLRRQQLPPLKLEMLQVGNIVNIFSKLIHITDTAPITRKVLFKGVESTFALIKPSPPSIHGSVITFIMQNGFRIVNMKNGTVDKDHAIQLYRSISGNNMLPLIIDYITSSEVIGLELVAPNAVAKWRSCLGATNPKDAAPGTLRRLYGQDMLRNVAHGCNDIDDAKENLELFFGYQGKVPRVPFRATFKDCTCCIIKPHAIMDGNIGSIIEMIATSDKFYISAMAMFLVKNANALEFFEVYKGILPEYENMCIHLTEGKCVAMEVKCTDPSVNCVCAFRKLCGPRDPDLCRQIYPDSIRARYGKTILHNAVHCTDLPEDGVKEVEYFFKLISNDHF
ncbi:nucleoside diphosphate kinase homolog 7-like [Plodia interpunctella]|uniref:nucleoside diphosphate kinase homolog 7-like n=1 Tax=Plodia interpunctella TaxID=58824 RepID=UPI0023683F13|nr:nucleoside diphosphate kinase 7-like [Plodia interpunctella]